LLINFNVPKLIDGVTPVVQSNSVRALSVTPVGRPFGPATRMERTVVHEPNADYLRLVRGSSLHPYRAKRAHWRGTSVAPLLLVIVVFSAHGVPPHTTVAGGESAAVDQSHGCVAGR
jgi:hypothetical protein